MRGLPRAKEGKGKERDCQQARCQVDTIHCEMEGVGRERVGGECSRCISLFHTRTRVNGPQKGTCVYTRQRTCTQVQVLSRASTLFQNQTHDTTNRRGER